MAAALPQSLQDRSVHVFQLDVELGSTWTAPREGFELSLDAASQFILPSAVTNVYPSIIRTVLWRRS